MLEIVQAIATYGVFPVILAVILFVIIRMFINQQNINKTQRDDNAAQEERLSAMFDKMLENILKINKNTNPHHTPQEEEDNRRVNLLINMQLQKIQLSTNANRVSCFLYHNGGRDVSGRSFQKMSMTHESVDFNTVPVMSSYQNVPRMMFPILVHKLSEQGYYYIEDINAIQKVDAITYQSFFSRGAKSVFIQAIQTTEQVVLGFVAIEFTTNQCTDIDELKRCLINKTIKISGALEVDNNASVFGKGGNK